MYCRGWFVYGHLNDVFKQCQHDDSVRHDPDSPKCQLGFFGFFIGLHQLADKYNLPGLEQYAYIHLDYELRKSRHFSYYRLGFEEFLKVIDKAYDSACSNDVLRGIMVKHIICECRQFTSSAMPWVCGLVMEHQDFAGDVLRSLLTDPLSTQKC